MTDVIEALVIDEDPDPKKPWQAHQVILRIEVPPKATTNGWHDTNWTRPHC
jgi:hypothetical protein